MITKPAPEALPQPLNLVLLPGLDGTGRLFRWLIEALPAAIQPIVISLPAQGGDYAALEAEVLGSLPLDQPLVILGESFSGPLALRLATRKSRNVVAVILVASFVAHPIAWLPGVARYLMTPLMFRLPIPVPLLRWLLLGKDPPAALVECLIECLRPVDPTVLARRAKAALSVDATDDLMRCPVPVLYLGASQDRLLSPRTAARLKALRPDLDCRMFEAPHFLLQRAPGPAAQAITGFLLRNSLVKAPALDG